VRYLLDVSLLLIRRLVVGWLLLSLLVGFSVELSLNGWEGMGKRHGDMDVSPFQYPDYFFNCSLFTTTPAWAGAAVGGSMGVTLGLALAPPLALAARAKFKHSGRRGFNWSAPSKWASDDRTIFIFWPAMVGMALGNILGGMIAGAPFLVVERTVDRLLGRWPPCGG